MDSLKSENTKFIKDLARDLGFMFCGITKAEKLQDEENRLEMWLKENRNGKMAYMENHFDKRLDPSKLVPGAKSVVCLAYNYFPEETQNKEAPKISKYAYGVDYHKVIKKKLKEFMFRITEEIGNVEGRIFVDSAPLLEKSLAKKAGIGWMGKNSNIINPKSGSFFFLSELVLDLDLDYDSPMKDFCGTCTACIDACPTDAIHNPYQVDGSKCISYFTIELKDEIIPNEYSNKFENWMFGCDICQDVCPWNRFSKPHNEPLFTPSYELLNMDITQWHELTEEIFEALFHRSAVKRTKFKGLKRNLNFLKGN